MHVAGPLSLSLVLATECFAGPQDISPELRQRAIQICTTDAMRLCPAALMNEEQTVACMSGKRALLTPACRVVFDQVARLLRK